jgi:hypothetical protein
MGRKADFARTTKKPCVWQSFFIAATGAAWCWVWYSRLHVHPVADRPDDQVLRVKGLGLWFPACVPACLRLKLAAQRRKLKDEIVAAFRWHSQHLLK